MAGEDTVEEEAEVHLPMEDVVAEAVAVAMAVDDALSLQQPVPSKYVKQPTT